MTAPRQYRAGQSVEDYCRQCKEDRIHSIIVVDSHGQPLRVTCDFCRSEHNYRGGPRSGPPRSTVPPSAETPGTPRPKADAPHRPEAAMTHTPDDSRSTSLSSSPSSLTASPSTPVSSSPSTSLRASDLELLIRRIIREESGLTPVAPAEKWRGGQLVLRPGKPGVQEKTIPIDSFFNKIVMLRNRLRTLEQQVNASELPDDQKLKLQAYITGCYGSLTSFNVLVADEGDRFVGTGGD